jgi:hypothetical protein
LGLDLQAKQFLDRLYQAIFRKKGASRTRLAALRDSRRDGTKSIFGRNGASMSRLREDSGRKN